MKMDFDYLNYLTSTKLKKVIGKNVKPVSHLILKISFSTLFGCAVKITLDIYPIPLWLEDRPCPKDSKTDKFRFVKILTSTINFNY